jgi:hypothetical protein
MIHPDLLIPNLPDWKDQREFVFTMRQLGWN